MTPGPLAVRTVALYVTDPARSRRFYEDFLGLRVIASDAGRVQLRIGTTRLLLHPTDTDDQDRRAARHGRCEIYFEVNDVEALVQHLSDQGVPVIQSPTDQPWGERDAVVEDPDGFPVFFTQVGPDVSG